MLREIRCDKFHQQSIQFHGGLNVILGDEKASNSIGKSTALLIIDFVFGGDSYVKQDISKDILLKVGNHTILFSFQFNNEVYYFSRSTNEPNVITKCHKDYNREEIWTKEQYTQWLKEKYECSDIVMPFRQIVSLYSRIYGKGNTIETKPLHIIQNESGETAINRLLGLFETLETLDALKREAVEAERKSAIYKKASDEHVIIVHSGKANKKEREEKIRLLEQEITGLQNQLSTASCSLSEEQLRLASKMYEDLEPLNLRLAKLQSQLRRLNRSASDIKQESRGEIDELQEFFPTINMSQLDEVNSFHQQLSNILSKEVREQINKTERAIGVLTQQVNEINDKIHLSLEAKRDEATVMAIKRLMERVVERERLRIEDKYAQDMEQWKDQKKQTKEMYENKKAESLLDIERKLNETMKAYNKQLSKSLINPPILKLMPNNYTFECENDRGTGTMYAGLIILDISVLQLTMLPFLIHDTVLLKNISDETVDKLISFYQKFPDKQIFISLDKSNHYGMETSRALQSYAVLRLGQDSEALFGRSWNKRQ